MTAKAVGLVYALLVAAGAVAAEDQTSLVGKEFTVDNASGAVECTGSCVVKFTKPVTFSSSVASGAVSVTTSESTGTLLSAAKVRVVRDNMAYEVEGLAVVRKLADDVTELRADKIRISKIPASL